MERKQYPVTLRGLQELRTSKGISFDKVSNILNEMHKEALSNKNVTMIERIMLHIGDVSRQHNILTEMGIKSPTGGAQERATFRHILKWWSENMTESFSRNIGTIVEFTVLENIMFYQNTTDRYTGNKQKTEILFPNREIVYGYLSSQIKNGKNLNLIAKHLPKLTTGQYRTAKKTIKVRGGETFEFKIPVGKKWFKLNGKTIKAGTKTVTVKTGDVVTYPREKQKFTLEKQKFVNDWITGFCDIMDWNINQYIEFRKLQNTAEQKISSKSVLSMAKSDFFDFLDKLTTGQRFMVSKTVCYKDGDNLKPKDKWNDLGVWFIEWENGQEEIADKLRVAAASDDVEAKEKLMKQFKVKSTGLQTLDLLGKIFDKSSTDQMINNTYQSLIEKMDLIANVFPIIDGSASMNASVTGRGGWSSPALKVDSKFNHVTNFDVAAAMAIAFSTRNPVPEFRNTFGWFSRNFKIIGKSKYVNDAPNQHVSSREFTKKVNAYNILSETNTFTQNLKNIRKSNPGDVASTNMFASIEYFVNLVNAGKLHPEDLPNSLLYITDNENNTGKSPREALELAYSIGWNPLLIFWGITRLPDSLEREIKGIKNILLVGGFSEGVLSQILRGIKSGSVDPEDELWSIYEDKRYSVIK